MSVQIIQDKLEVNKEAMGVNLIDAMSIGAAEGLKLALNVGGMLLADITSLHTNMGFIGLRAMPAAVLGGLTSIPGALVGGLIIGLVEHLIGVSLGSGFKEVSAYVVLLAVLLLRPAGLFGTVETKRV